MTPPRTAAGGFALWNLGFRPFYLLASVFAAVSILLWIAEYAGYLPGGYLRDPVWHAHEMLFGYTIAVVTGFLFTAVRNWTGQPTPTGALLAGYALLWILGRI
ncbi:MAG TPA: NnrS family protein, partial [Casimicrobiaceae bacterium]|nr:NnrS family protein [Casimicrobiaceae bacterium]